MVIRGRVWRSKLNPTEDNLGDEVSEKIEDFHKFHFSISGTAFWNASFLREPFRNKRSPGSASNLINRFVAPANAASSHGSR